MNKRFIGIIVFLLLLVGGLGFLFSNLSNTDVVSNSVGLNDNDSLNQTNSTDNVNDVSKNRKELIYSNDSINKNNSKKVLNNENINVKKDFKSKISPVNSNKKVNKTNNGFKNGSNTEIKLLSKKNAYGLALKKINSEMGENYTVLYKGSDYFDEKYSKYFAFHIYDKKSKKTEGDVFVDVETKDVWGSS